MPRPRPRPAPTPWRARFEAGATGALDLLDAQRSLLGLRRQQAQLAGQRAVATAGLVRALGGGW